MSVGLNINLHFDQAGTTVDDRTVRAARIVCAWLDDHYGPDPDRDWALTSHLREQMGDDYGEDMI